jgi:hypothetical protein
LYLAQTSRLTGARQFEEPLQFEVRAGKHKNGKEKTGLVTVTFSELPIEEWFDLTRDEKRRLGITDGAGVSVVRADREIDFGWFFMGQKRRENYDDWWRCEIRFDPILDEVFGITHTKQQIRPQEDLQETLNPELERIAKALNARVRRNYADLRAGRQSITAESKASSREEELKPLPKPSRQHDSDAMDELTKRHPFLRESIDGDQRVQYRIVEDEPNEPWFYRPVVQNGRLVVLVNRHHEFYKRWYSILLNDESAVGKQATELLQMMLLAAARAEAEATKKSERETLEEFRRAWSDALNVFLRK